MTLSAQAREYMAKRDELSENEKEVVDCMFEVMYSAGIAECVKLATDDRAAELEAAIIKFIIDSREE